MISVVVPTYNRVDCLLDMLASLHEQDFRDFEVLVIDQSEEPGEEKINRILQSCGNLKYFQIDKRGRSIAKNFAIGQAAGDIILFCDDDIIAGRDFLSVHHQLHQEMQEVGAVSCHLIEAHESEIDYDSPLRITPYGRFINRPNSVRDGYVSSLNGGNMSFKSSALVKAGYFEEQLRGTSMLEEPDIAYRLLQHQYRLYFSAKTKVRHYPQYNGNINTQKQKSYDWLKAYFFNQYYFVFRNKRSAYLPLVHIYLMYRTLVEMFSRRIFSFRFCWLPFSSAMAAFGHWQKMKARYPSPWFTPVWNQVQVLKKVFN